MAALERPAAPAAGRFTRRKQTEVIMARLTGIRRVAPRGAAGWKGLLGATLLLGSLGSAGAALAQTAESTDEPSVSEREGELVACLLPAEIDRLGQLTILGARQKIETSRANCAARGGEVIDEHDAPPQPAEPTR
jgi:hypothetical protein